MRKGSRLELGTLLLVALLVASVSAQQPAPELALQGGRASLLTGAVAFNRDGRLLIEGSQGRVRVFEVATGRVVRSLETPGVSLTGRGASFGVHPRADVIAILGGDGAVTGYHLETGRELWQTPAISDNSTVLPQHGAVRFSADGEILLVQYGAIGFGQSFGGALRGAFKGFAGRSNRESTRVRRLRWRVRDMTLLGSDTIDVDANAVALRDWLTVDGQWFADEQLRRDRTSTQMRDVTTEKPIGPPLPGVFIAGHAGTDRVIVESDAGFYSLHSATTGALVKPLFGGHGWFSADGSRFLATVPGSALSTFWSVYDVRTGERIANATDGTPIGVQWAISPDGSIVATVQLNTVIVASLDQQPVQYVSRSGEAAGEPLTEVHFQPKDGAVDARLLRAFTPAETVMAAFTPDGRWLVARAQDGAFDIWEVASGNRMSVRLPAMPEQRGVPPKPISAAVVAGEAWPPVAVQQVNPATVSVGAPIAGYGGVMCRSADERFTIVEEVTADGYSAVLRDIREARVVADLVDLGVDLRAGCSIDANGRRIVVARMDRRRITRETKPATRVSDSIGCRMFLRCSTPLVVVDVARRTATPLREGKGSRTAAGEFAFTARDIIWTQGGKTVMHIGYPGLSPSDVVPTRGWDASSGAELDLAAVGLSGTSLGIIPGTTWLVHVDQPIGVFTSLTPGVAHDIWDLETLQRITRLESSANPVSTSMMTTNGRVLVGPDGDGGVSARRLSDGKLLGTLRPLANGDWIVASPSGLFDGSPEGWRQIAWRTTSGLITQPGELFFSEFYQPGLLADVLAGRDTRLVRPIDVRDRRQPELRLNATAVDARSARVRLRVQVPQGGTGAARARDLRLFRNGVLVRVWRGDLAVDDEGVFVGDADVSLVSGENRLTAYVFNGDDIKSGDATAVLTSTAPARAGTVFVIAVGVNRYANRAFDLQYAVPDATAFAAAVGAHQRSLGAGRVEVVTLLDAEATRANILLALTRLGGTSRGPLPPGAPGELAKLEAAGPEDTVIVYYAGHGLATEARFHLIPSDMTYTGSRADVGRALPELTGAGISDQELERVFEPIDARHILLVIDACHSGQAIEADDNRFGPLNSRGLAQLAYEKGMSILTGSQAYEAALESAQLGHGYLTYALVEEGLKAAADRTPQDGDVTAAEWFAYAAARVPQLQLAAIDRAHRAGRILTFDTNSAPGAAGTLQTPRIFRRREVFEAPLIVARPGLAQSAGGGAESSAPPR
jgi:hypothetical protein